MGKIDVDDIRNFISMEMDREWENLPDSDRVWDVSLGDVEYKSLIRYTTLETVLNYIERGIGETRKKKIGLFVQSSNQELFSKNTKILMDYYKRAVEKLGLNVEVYAFTGNDDKGNNFAYIKDGYVYLPCDDRDVSLKTYELMRNVKFGFLSEYDVIVKTNCSTVVNLEKLCEFCDSGSFDGDRVYCCEGVTWENGYGENASHPFYREGGLHYPRGNFMFFSNRIFDIFYNNYENAKDYLSTTLVKSDSWFDQNDKNTWTGVSEDAVWGYVMHYIGIEFKMLQNYARVFDCGLWESNIGDCGDFSDLMAVFCRVPADYESRLMVEPGIVEMVTKFYDNVSSKKVAAK